MFYHTRNLILMLFVYKSYQRIIRHHLYKNIKYIPIKKQQHTSIHSNEDTTTYKYAYIIKSAFIAPHSFAQYYLQFSMALNC